jgi:hypothetical protein
MGHAAPILFRAGSDGSASVMMTLLELQKRDTLHDIRQGGCRKRAVE